MSTLKDKKRIAKTSLYPNQVIVDSKQFLRMTSDKGTRVKAVRFIFPRLGKPGDFGKFSVRYER